MVGIPEEDQFDQFFRSFSLREVDLGREMLDLTKFEGAWRSHGKHVLSFWVMVVTYSALDPSGDAKTSKHWSCFFATC